MVRRLLLLAAFLAMVWCALAGAIAVWPHGDKPIPANAVFVLSGSRDRLPVGLKLVREGEAPLLVVSRTSPNTPALETQACAHRLDVRVLCVQARPYSTVGEAELLARLARQRHWHAVDVVTSRYHVVRARILIRRCYHGTLRVIGAPTPVLALVENALLETVKLGYHELFHRAC